MAKTQLEDVVKQFGATVPDSSKTFKAYYLRISKEYNAAKASYEGYKGSIKDCIYLKNSQKKIKACLVTKVLNIRGKLDTLYGYFDDAFTNSLGEHPSKEWDQIITQNTGIITADFIEKILTELVDAGLKIYDVIQKKNQKFKDDYLAALQSKDYVLGDFDDLIKRQPVKK